MSKYQYDLTKFINEQYKKGNQIISIGFDSRGAWEGCTGEICFANGTKVCVSDEVKIFDIYKNQMMEKYKKYKNIMATHPSNIDFIDNVYVITYDIQGHEAFTLNEDDIGVHEDGWAINGKVWEDWFTWVNEFEGIKNGERVWGDFEKVVYCTSLEALEDFLENHKPDTWDYWAI